MAEAGVDISGHTYKHIDEVKEVKLDVVVTVCGHAHETCPFFPGNCTVVHAGFDDPPKMTKELADQDASEEEQLQCYRKVRDQMKPLSKPCPKH